MAIDPSAVGAVTKPQLFEWTDRDTVVYALGIGFGAEFQGAVVMASGQFDGGRLTFKIENREIKMGLGILFVQLDRLSDFVFRRRQPPSFANQNAQIKVCFGVTRIEIDCLAESSQAGIQFILLVVDDAKG